MAYGNMPYRMFRYGDSNPVFHGNNNILPAYSSMYNMKLAHIKTLI
jgi:hypothetical protein